MARDILDRKIRHLLDEILVMDSMVETATGEAIKALKNHDLALAREVYASDNQINTTTFRPGE